MAGRLYIESGTPGAAWADAGLEAMFPGTFVRLRALSDSPSDLQAECDCVLLAWQDALDNAAIEEAAEGAELR